MSSTIVKLPDVYRDAFGRTRTADPVTQFDYQAQYDTGPLFWETTITGNAGSAHLPNESSVRLRTTTTTGDKVVRQSRQYVRYQPGKSQLIMFTFVLGAAADNVRKRIGYFDTSNGIFLEQSGGAVKWVRRTNVTGTPADNAVTQTAWSVDNGLALQTGDLAIDWTKAQIGFIDHEWLGNGRVRCGLVIGGEFVTLHEFMNANTTLTSVFQTTANLPVRYEVENTGTATSATNDLVVTCVSVISEGGFEEERGIPHSRERAAAGLSVTTEVPVLSLRPTDTFNSIVNRMGLRVTSANFMARTKSCLFKIYYGATLTGASWTDHSATFSGMEYDISASALTGGFCIGTFWVPASGVGGGNQQPGQTESSITSRLPLSLAIDGSHPTTAGGFAVTDSITITAQTAESPDATLAYASLSWVETR